MEIALSHLQRRPEFEELEATIKQLNSALNCASTAMSGERLGILDRPEGVKKLTSCSYIERCTFKTLYTLCYKCHRVKDSFTK